VNEMAERTEMLKSLPVEVLKRHLSFLEYSSKRAEEKDPNVERKNVHKTLFDLYSSMADITHRTSVAANNVTIAKRRLEEASNVENELKLQRALSIKSNLKAEEAATIKELKYVELLQMEDLDVKEYIKKYLKIFQKESDRRLSQNAD